MLLSATLSEGPDPSEQCLTCSLKEKGYIVGKLKDLYFVDVLLGFAYIGQNCIARINKRAQELQHYWG